MTEAEKEWASFFYFAKEEKRMVRVTDKWGVVREGRLYRCGYDRINVIPLDGSGAVHSEVYLSNIVAADIKGPEPEGLPDFFGDWNTKPRG